MTEETKKEPQTDLVAAAKTAYTDTDLMRENEMLKAKVTKLEGYLSQAIDIANKANDQAKVREEAEKADLIDRIKVDSNNRISPETLKNKSLNDLRLIKTTLDVSRDDTFASVAALQAEKDSKKNYGIDYWDRETQQWRVK